MKTSCRTVGVVAFLLIIFGCSSKGELQVQRGLDSRIDHKAVASLLVSFMAKGKSASHPLSSENDMDDAIREAIDQIILELKK